MLLLEPLDRLQALVPSAALSVVVDDIVISGVGGLQRVVGDIATAAWHLKVLLGEVDLAVAVKKARALAN
eukprot:3302104-Pyramimonas_sp.AAC.1